MTYLVVVIPIISLGVYLYYWSYNNTSQHISNTTAGQIEFYMASLEHEFNRIKLQQFDLLEDTDLNKMALAWNTMDHKEQRSVVHHLLYRLASFKHSSPYIKNIYIHIRSIGMTISAVHGAYDFDTIKYEQMLRETERQSDWLVEWASTLHMNAIKPSTLSGEKPIYVVQIELDALQLRDFLRSLAVHPDSYSSLVLDRTGFAIRSQTIPVEPDIDTRRYAVASDALGISLISYLPEAVIEQPLAGFKIWAWIFAAASVCAVLIYALFTYNFVHRPMLLLIRSFKRMESGELDFQIHYKYTDEFRLLYTRFNVMVKRLKELIDQDYRQKMMMQRAELKQLQSQINPHFLYNNFFILSSLAHRGDLKEVERFTAMLGEYFRFITRIDQDHVPLSEEVRHSLMYTKIQKIRFSRRIRIDFADLPAEMEHIPVPRLIVQPIIENAFKHSLERMPDQGLLRVQFRMENNEAQVIIEDNGANLTDGDIDAIVDKLANPGEQSETTGLVNIHRRLQLTFGEGSGLILSRSELGGLKVIMKLRKKEVTARVLPVNRG